MAMMRWYPFRDLENLRSTVDQLFEDAFVRPGGPASARSLPLDVYETPEAVVVKAALPGAKPEDVDVNVTGELLTIRGKIHSDAEKEEARKWNWLLNEMWHGEFVRTLTLPSMVQAGKAEASFEDGVLTLMLPKAEEVKPKQIKIKAREMLESR